MPDEIMADPEFWTVWAPSVWPEDEGKPCREGLELRLFGTLDEYIDEAHQIIERAVDRWRPESVWAAFSGGNDSTVMLDIVHEHVDGIFHVDTTIGVRQTREFVRQMADLYGLPLEVRRPPKSYDEIVSERGFFGPADHEWAYRLLKKEAVRQFKREMLPPGESSNLMLLTGMRAHESRTRLAHGSDDRIEERIAWVNPIRHFTRTEMVLYRERYPQLPKNPVNDYLGKSGECLCGCFSHGPTELELVRDLDPDTATQIEALQDRLRADGSPFCRWGPGGQAVPESYGPGPLCSGCGVLFEGSDIE